MSIGVQSYPELYTLLMGWDLYDKVWELLTQTGIAYVPFIGIILKNIYRAYVMHGNKSAEFSLRSMEISLITTLVIVLFVAAPFIPLSAHSVSFSPLCGKDKTTSHPGDTGTTYDKAFAIPSGDIRVPLWWYAVIAISEGITSNANTFVGCVPDLRKMVTEVNMTKITDPELKEELQNFETMCYVPARTQFFNDSRQNNTSNTGRINDNVKKYGVEDTEWLGSHAFSDVYYQKLKATTPVPHFPYQGSQDINNETNKTNPPQYGTPTCYDWWNNNENGLKKRLFNALPKTFNDEFKDYINTENAKDNVIKRIISGAPSGYAGYDNANEMRDVGYSHIISSIGIWYKQSTEYPKLYAAAQAAPIIQALLLLMGYAFLPFALVFGGYNPGLLVKGSIIIFSLIFWSFIWHLVSFTDKALMQALYQNWFAQQGAGATLTDMIIGSLVIGAPLFWFMFMGALGISVGNAVSSAVGGMNQIGTSAAGNGLNVAQDMAKAAATIVM